MGEAPQCPVLVLRQLTDAMALGRRRATGQRLEADAAAFGLADLVGGEPVLPTVPLGDRTALQNPAAGLTLASLHQADAGEQCHEDGLGVGADRPARPAGAREEG